MSDIANAKTTYARVGFTVKEFGPDSSGHAQPFIALEMDSLHPAIDAAEGLFMLHFRNPRTSIEEARRAADHLNRTFDRMALLTFR